MVMALLSSSSHALMASVAASGTGSGGSTGRAFFLETMGHKPAYRNAMVQAERHSL